MISPKRPKPARAARNAFGEVLRFPAIASLIDTALRFVFGLTFSISPESFATMGASARSLNFGSSRPCDTRIWPYCAARDNRLRRSRIGAVTTSPRKKTALPRKTIARNRIMASTSEGNDLFQDCRADEHHRHTDDDQQPTVVSVVQRANVRGFDLRDRHRHEERDAHQRVRGHATHRSERPDLPRELLALADRVRDHVEERRKRTADLALNRHGGDRELQGLSARALPPGRHRLLHPPA